MAYIYVGSIMPCRSKLMCAHCGRKSRNKQALYLLKKRCVLSTFGQNFGFFGFLIIFIFSMNFIKLTSYITILFVLLAFLATASAGPAAYASCQATAAAICWYSGPFFVPCYAQTQSLCSYLLVLPLW